MPATIALLPHCGFLSETSRMLAIAEALREAGAEVHIATHGGPFEHLVTDAGWPLRRLEPLADRDRCARFIDGVVQIGRPGARLMSPEEVRAGVAAEVAWLREIGAHAVVIGFTLTANLSARLVGATLVASHGGSFVGPVFDHGLAPAPTQMPFPGTEWLPAVVKRWLANQGPTRLRDPAAFLNEIAAELGVEPVPTLAALMMGDLTLLTDTPEVLGLTPAQIERWTPRRPDAYRPNPRVVCVGPMFARLPMPVPEPIEAWLHDTPGTAQVPTAYVALTSATPGLVRDVVRRVRDAGPRVIVAGTVHDLADLASDPMVRVGGILPSDRIMPRVDLAVVMGGQGSTQTAMSSGTPFIGIPLHPEQELNVHLAARHGAAIGVARRDARGPRLTQAVQRVLAEPGFRPAAKKLQAMYAGQDAPRAAARAILQDLGRQVAVPTAG